jgi:hypothetical protein
MQDNAATMLFKHSSILMTGKPINRHRRHAAETARRW